jgi:hypothetical protein
MAEAESADRKLDRLMQSRMWSANHSFSFTCPTAVSDIRHPNNFSRRKKQAMDNDPEGYFPCG